MSLVFAPGCARRHYYQQADHDTYGVLSEKSCARPWYLPDDYSVLPTIGSRLFDYTDPVDPSLPDPGPNLYTYELPPLAEVWDGDEERSTRPLPAPAEANGAGQPVYADTEEGLTIQPIPKTYWEVLPAECLARMLEFESVREEFRRTYGEEPPESLRDQSQKLTFNNIVEVAYLNSREYQAEKEALYSTALALTLERYDYMTKFSTFGNGTDVNYDHVRAAGLTTNTLGVPSRLRADRMTALGGTIVADFANNVVLTFNGPAGFAENINSNLLFEFTQSVFQRDVLLEPLIQSERNVVYAARDFARFRKRFFLDLARTYYTDLLSTYRGIEIDTQNYFAFVRALDQAEAEVRSGVGNAPPRVQIDQIQQNMLGGRSSLISTCNRLETSLDRLKLTLGLPTEMPINIDLRELETLTRRDEIEVRGELVLHARERVELQLASQIPDREDILSAAVVLLERVLDWFELRQNSNADVISEGQLRALRARLRVDEAYEDVDRTHRQLLLTRRSVPPPVPITIFQRTMNLVQSRLELVGRQLQLADELETHPRREETLATYIGLSGRVDDVLERVARFLRGEDEDLLGLQAEAEAILQELELLDGPARQITHEPAERPDKQVELREAIAEVKGLLDTLEQLAIDAGGLAEVVMTADDAMVTALVQRFELMNERGFLADDWRGIKLAADDLKSVLNLNVRHSLQTRNNRPFTFTADDSRTELGMSFDAPLNRRSQRNAFRSSVLNYQSGRRGLMALEDNIKFAARQDLRQLNLDRVQYDISVISAALASERVYSTQLELALGLATVTARDFLEAQQAYRQSISSVANGRLGYIVDRAQLAFDLELMMLDDAGVWPELNNEEYQPFFAPVYPGNAGPAYGELTKRVWSSKKIKRMLYYPPPGYSESGEEIEGVAIPAEGADDVLPAPEE